ncbi:Free methionine-R-sulfoxide reductase [Anaerohalosphaera lusitana]|uniref:Free methionine-R-sulfoxide reductase n=1 Tax=Anaerohalosphaera lusitana TaxID=1936003 RepID=A0A1U9NQ44_9BACT|nr:GAF domain-containing protein [Anaerohalosphaera lusitana]AQT69907.1 Free methionine-R-sulfoxide reductase [Anaerohalosphaera lusitana]
MNSDAKSRRYERIHSQLSDLLSQTPDTTARMATTAALLHHKFKSFFWTGFYRLIDGQLTVGPYQGPLACQILEKDKGVCWAGVNSREPVVVPNVHEFPGHIACDSRSKSEIVVPCKDKNGNIYAVLDIDSTDFDTFDETDAAGLENITALLTR